jgi:DNA replication protein DnaC
MSITDGRVLEPLTGGELDELADILAAQIRKFRRDTDYLGADGFPHCAVCREARLRVPQNPVFLTLVPHPCACDRAKMELTERKLAETRARERIENAIMEFPRRMRGYTFTGWQEISDNDRACKAILMRYAANFSRALSEGKGVLLTGKRGTGKTYALAATARAILESGYSVAAVNASQITELNGLDADDWRRAINVQFLALDDFGATRYTEFAQERIYRFINERLNAKRPTAITTNLSLKEILTSPKGDEMSGRINERVLELTCATHICFDGMPMRRKQIVQDSFSRPSWLDQEGAAV